MNELLIHDCVIHEYPTLRRLTHSDYANAESNFCANFIRGSCRHDSVVPPWDNLFCYLQLQSGKPLRLGLSLLLGNYAVSLCFYSTTKILFCWTWVRKSHMSVISPLPSKPKRRNYYLGAEIYKMVVLSWTNVVKRSAAAAKCGTYAFKVCCSNKLPKVQWKCKTLN